MDVTINWLLVFVVLFWCYFIASNRHATKTILYSLNFFACCCLSLWAILLTPAATSFSGWTLMGHPGLFDRDGHQVADAIFYAIAISLTGVIFLKRQWILGERFGFLFPENRCLHIFMPNPVHMSGCR